ncbi:unnamed protein product [Colias eurytheme]|nr:unnamed protein product [Colias eurytheme]
MSIRDESLIRIPRAGRLGGSDATAREGRGGRQRGHSTWSCRCTPQLLRSTSNLVCQLVHKSRSYWRKLVKRVLELPRERRRSEIRSHAVSQKDTNLLASLVLGRGRSGGRGRAIGPPGHASAAAAAADAAASLRTTPLRFLLLTFTFACKLYQTFPLAHFNFKLLL